ncbi:fibronectin type III domain-containing protein, partial [bacterium]|nr:fibronectin type III domain-containing protein [bacterium]
MARITHGSTATRLEYYPAASPSGAPATNYVVQYRTATVNANGTYSATGSWITVDKDDHTTTYYTITGLQAAQAYLFRVAAEGSAGIGPFHYPRGAVTVN